VASAIEYARKMGIQSPLNPYLSLALGASEVTLKEMVAAYSVFASGGIYNEPYFIKEIRERGGNVLEHHIKTPYQVIPPATAYMVTNMLKGVVQRGTGKIAQQVERPVAAKTGTTDDCTDAWFIGFTPELAVGVWVGFDVKRSPGPRLQGPYLSGS
jgi:penicillin-binding protein 1A